MMNDRIARTMLLAQGGILLGLSSIAGLLKTDSRAGDAVDAYQRNVENMIKLIGEALEYGEVTDIDENDTGGS